MQRNPDLRICYDRHITNSQGAASPVLQKMREQALLRATGGATPRQASHALDPTKTFPPPHLALITSKAWPAGSHLKCRFLEGSPVQQAKVIHKAKMWEQYAN